MDNQPSFDRSILIPVGIGAFALIGLCVILVAGRIFSSNATVEEVPTSTSFQYALVGTEPAIVTTTAETAQSESPGPNEPTAIILPTVPDSNVTPEFTATSPLIVLGTDTPGLLVTNTRTPTSASTAPLGAGTYDNLDSRMVYNGDWTTQSGVPGAYQNTLQVSTTVGNSVGFRFIGQEVRIFFQAAPSLVTIRLTLDGTAYDMNQANSSTQTYEWVLPSVANGTHTVSITHLSGGSINLDYVIVPEVPTTPTSTATPTQQ